MRGLLCLCYTSYSSYTFALFCQPTAQTLNKLFCVVLCSVVLCCVVLCCVVLCCVVLCCVVLCYVMLVWTYTARQNPQFTFKGALHCLFIK